MAKLSLHLRDCVQKAGGNWAYVNIDVLLDAAEYLERFAQPEPEEPTDEELQALLYYEFTTSTGHGERSDPIAFARAVLARWGRLSISPVSLSERSPGPEDCDANGRCWFISALGCSRWNLDDQISGLNNIFYTHWLPHYALPIPTLSNEENK